jgi:DNA-binding response OmpR family regulator
VAACRTGFWGSDEGIDLYLVKPIDLAELGAAIRAVARRVNQLNTHVPVWRLEPDGYILVRPDGKIIILTLMEFQILQALAVAGAKPVERDALIQAMGRKPDAYDPRALEVTLSRLRSKLGANSPLKAVRNRGYRFMARLQLGVTLS